MIGYQVVTVRIDGRIFSESYRGLLGNAPGMKVGLANSHQLRPAPRGRPTCGRWWRNNSRCHQRCRQVRDPLTGRTTSWPAGKAPERKPPVRFGLVAGLAFKAESGMGAGVVQIAEVFDIEAVIVTSQSLASKRPAVRYGQRPCRTISYDDLSNHLAAATALAWPVMLGARCLTHPLGGLGILSGPAWASPPLVSLSSMSKTQTEPGHWRSLIVAGELTGKDTHAAMLMPRAPPTRRQPRWVF